MKELTYDDLLHALRALTPEQKHLPARIVIGRKVLPVYDTALSCECGGGARTLVGDNYPLLIGNSQHSCGESPKQHCKACTQEVAERRSNNMKLTEEQIEKVIEKLHKSKVS